MLSIINIIMILIIIDYLCTLDKINISCTYNEKNILQKMKQSTNHSMKKNKFKRKRIGGVS